MRPANLAVLCWFATLSCAAPSLAQDEPEYMVVQRCVWRCQHNTEGEKAYNRCVARNCTVSVDSPDDDIRDLALRRAKTVRPGVWTYGDHPLFGTGAYVETVDGALGLGCGLTNGNPIMIRVTPEAVGGPDAILMFDNASGATPIARGDGGIVEVPDTACTTSLETFAKAGTTFLVHAKMVGVEAKGDEYVLTLQRGKSTRAVVGTAAAVEAFGATRFPMKGSAAAVRKLLAACPIAREALQNDCW